MNADVAWVWRGLRLVLFFVAASSGLVAIVLALTAIPEAGRNPASTDFAWLRNDWLAGFLIANVLVVLAIRIASGRTRIVFAVLLLLAWGAGIVPGYQYLLYQLG